MLSQPGVFPDAEFKKAAEQFNGEPFGFGVLRILDSRTRSCEGCGTPGQPDLGEVIEWLRFRVEVRLPPAKERK